MITLGTLAPGSVVPSVRDLAKALRVAPTETTVFLQGESGTGKEVAARFIHQASPRLVDAGVLAVKRGEGTYVADVPTQPKRAERNEMLRDAATRLAGVAIAVGASLDDATSELEGSYQRLVRETRRKA